MILGDPGDGPVIGDEGDARVRALIDGCFLSEPFIELVRTGQHFRIHRRQFFKRSGQNLVPRLRSCFGRSVRFHHEFAGIEALGTVLDAQEVIIDTWSLTRFDDVFVRRF